MGSTLSVPFSFTDATSQDTIRLLALIARLRHSACVACGRPICGHEAVFSVALGCQTTPRCLACLANAMEQAPDRLRDQLFEHVRRRECYGTAWDVESQHEFPTSESLPKCLWPVATPRLERADPQDHATPASAAARSIETDDPHVAAQSTHEPREITERWDAGDLGCGDLVLQLRGRMRALSPGDVLELVALDPGASSDIPAWCGLTGHALVRQAPPSFWIRRKEN